MPARPPRTPMSNPSRRAPPPGKQYYAVPQSPHTGGSSRQSSQSNSYGQAAAYQPPQNNYAPNNYAPNNYSQGGYNQAGYSQSYINNRQQETAHGVATGAIGGGYGPYSVSSLLCFQMLVASRGVTVLRCI